MNICICPQSCDCANPNGIGIAHLSNLCPEHNYFPQTDEECPIHDHMTPQEYDFWKKNNQQLSFAI
jgi:hypothetical protein